VVIIANIVDVWRERFDTLLTIKLVTKNLVSMCLNLRMRLCYNVSHDDAGRKKVTKEDVADAYRLEEIDGKWIYRNF
jgi:hypothetical protein